MDGTGIGALAELAAKAHAKVVPVGDVNFIHPGLKDARLPDPPPGSLKMHTLSGFVDFLQDDKAPAGLAIHVESPERVVAVSRELVGHFKQRHVFAEAVYDPIFAEPGRKQGEIAFAFGHYVSCETLIVALQAFFVPGDNRDDVLSVVGNIKQEQVRHDSDDGVSQAVTARRGVSLVSDVKLPNPVRLRPYRTFVEVEQPASLFVLRAKQGEDGEGKPRCALFEADGGAWRRTAVETIGRHLRAALATIPVFA